ncbi:hypothetical protein BH23THE1_BH23THE1_36130 [soil metagenome]
MKVLLSIFTGMIVLGISIFTMAFHPAPPYTTILVIKHAETADGTCMSPLTEKGATRAEMLVDLFRNTDLKNVYACGNKGSIGTLSALSSSKGLTLQTFDHTDLKKSLFKMYTTNQGSTIAISGDDQTVAQIVDLLTGINHNIRDSRGTIYQVKSLQLGKGELLTMPYATHLN